MTTDGYVEHIVKTKTSAGIMALIVLGAIITGRHNLWTSACGCWCNYIFICNQSKRV